MGGSVCCKAKLEFLALCPRCGHFQHRTRPTQGVLGSLRSSHRVGTHQSSLLLALPAQLSPSSPLLSPACSVQWKCPVQVRAPTQMS